jgi:hypothetical protein
VRASRGPRISVNTSTSSGDAAPPHQRTVITTTHTRRVARPRWRTSWRCARDTISPREVVCRAASQRVDSRSAGRHTFHLAHASTLSGDSVSRKDDDVTIRARVGPKRQRVYYRRASAALRALTDYHEAFNRYEEANDSPYGSASTHDAMELRRTTQTCLDHGIDVTRLTWSLTRQLTRIRPPIASSDASTWKWGVNLTQC